MEPATGLRAILAEEADAEAAEAAEVEAAIAAVAAMEAEETRAKAEEAGARAKARAKAKAKNVRTEAGASADARRDAKAETNVSGETKAPRRQPSARAADAPRRARAREKTPASESKRSSTRRGSTRGEGGDENARARPRDATARVDDARIAGPGTRIVRRKVRESSRLDRARRLVALTFFAQSASCYSSSFESSFVSSRSASCYSLVIRVVIRLRASTLPGPQDDRLVGDVLDGAVCHLRFDHVLLRVFDGFLFLLLHIHGTWARVSCARAMSSASEAARAACSAAFASLNRVFATTFA